MKLSTDHLSQGTSLSNTSNRQKAETTAQFLARAIHVSVTGKQITQISNLHYCRNLSVLYLYDNNITEIIGLEACSGLKRLYLQNNSIERIGDGLSVGLTMLNIVHLGHNKIRVVEGLDKLPSLQTLYLDHQNIDSALEFASSCFENTLSESLESLSVTDNRISDPSEIASLVSLKSLCLSNNNIDDLEPIQFILQSCTLLYSLSLVSNPLNKLNIKQQIILCSSPSLTTFNDKTITPTERSFLHKMHRANINKIPKRVAEKVAAQDKSEQVAFPHLPPYASQYRDLIISQMTSKRGAGGRRSIVDK